MLRNSLARFALNALFFAAAIALTSSAALAGGQALYEIDVNDARDLFDVIPQQEEQEHEQEEQEEQEQEASDDSEVIDLGHEILADDFPRSSISDVVFGSPTLVDGRHGRSLRLDNVDAGRFYEQIRLDLGLGTPGRNINACGVEDHALFVEDLDSDVLGYEIDLAFVVRGLSFFGPNRNFSIFFDGATALTRVDFTPKGEILLYDGDPEFLHLGNYLTGKPVSLQATFDYNDPSFRLVVNDEEIHFLESEELGRDLRSLRLSVGLGVAAPQPSVDIQSIRIDSIE
jgi:hypothetical protein